VKRFRGGLVFKAHRLLYHFTLGSRVSIVPDERRVPVGDPPAPAPFVRAPVPEVDSSCRLLIVPLFRGSRRFESLIFITPFQVSALHVSVMKRKLMMMMMRTCWRGSRGCPACRAPPLSATQGQILSQSPTDATRSWWHLHGT